MREWEPRSAKILHMQLPLRAFLEFPRGTRITTYAGQKVAAEVDWSRGKGPGNGPNPDSEASGQPLEPVSVKSYSYFPGVLIGQF